MTVIGMDLANETVLKAVVGALYTKSGAANDFQAVVQQADGLLTKATLPEVPSKANIQHVHNLRNDAQHKAKYPNEIDVNDCRTYTRDFLKQIILNVWGEDFESISLIEVVESAKVQGYLVSAQTELVKGDYLKSVTETVAAFEWTINEIRDSIVGKIPYYTDSFVVGRSLGKPHESKDVFRVFENMRNTIMRSVIGVPFAGYQKYERITKSVVLLAFAANGDYWTTYKGHRPDLREAEFVLEFATNSILQIESLVGDIDKPFES